MAATALACAWISLPRLAFAPVAAGIVLAWVWHCVQALQRGRFATHRIELGASGDARCQDGLGQWHEARVLPASYVSRWLIVVVLRARGRGPRALVLLPDCAAAKELRELRVWLRWRLAPP